MNIPSPLEDYAAVNILNYTDPLHYDNAALDRVVATRHGSIVRDCVLQNKFKPHTFDLICEHGFLKNKSIDISFSTTISVVELKNNFEKDKHNCNNIQLFRARFCTNFALEHLQLLAKYCPNLQVLDIMGCCNIFKGADVDRVTDVFRRFSCLKKLTVISCNPSSKIVSCVLRVTPLLSVIRLNSISYLEHDIYGKLGNQSITELVLQNCVRTPKLISGIVGNLKQLQILDLSIDPMAYVNIYGDISTYTDCCKYLEQLPKLEDLDVSGCAVDVEGIHALSPEDFKKLHLNNIQPSEAGCLRLCKVIEDQFSESFGNADKFYDYLLKRYWHRFDFLKWVFSQNVDDHLHIFKKIQSVLSCPQTALCYGNGYVEVYESSLRYAIFGPQSSRRDLDDQIMNRGLKNLESTLHIAYEIGERVNEVGCIHSVINKMYQYMLKEIYAIIEYFEKMDASDTLTRMRDSTYLFKLITQVIEMYTDLLQNKKIGKYVFYTRPEYFLRFYNENAVALYTRIFMATMETNSTTLVTPEQRGSLHAMQNNGDIKAVFNKGEECYGGNGEFWGTHDTDMAVSFIQTAFAIMVLSFYSLQDQHHFDCLSEANMFVDKAIFILNNGNFNHSADQFFEACMEETFFSRVNRDFLNSYIQKIKGYLDKIPASHSHARYFDKIYQFISFFMKRRNRPTNVAMPQQHP